MLILGFRIWQTLQPDHSVPQKYSTGPHSGLSPPVAPHLERSFRVHTWSSCYLRHAGTCRVHPSPQQRRRIETEICRSLGLGQPQVVR